MAHFYGRVLGAGKTMASRCGTKFSGLLLEALAKNGGISVSLGRDAANGVDLYRVHLHNKGGASFCLGSGVIGKAPPGPAAQGGEGPLWEWLNDGKMPDHPPIEFVKLFRFTPIEAAAKKYYEFWGLSAPNPNIGGFLKHVKAMKQALDHAKGGG